MNDISLSPIDIKPIQINPIQICIKQNNEYKDISTPLIYNIKINLKNIYDIIDKNDKNDNDNYIDNDNEDKEFEINDRIIKFYEEIYKNPEEQINKLLEYDFSNIYLDLDDYNKYINDDFPNELIEYSLRPILTFDKEKEKLEDRLNDETERTLKFKLTMKKITELLENDDEEIIKIIFEKIKSCPNDEIEKRFKDPSRTKKLAELIIKNKYYIYILWIKYYYKLYINLLYDYNNLLNKSISLNKSINPNLDYFDLYENYKTLELQYKEIIDYFNDLKDKFLNLQSAFKYINSKNTIKYNTLSNNHSILRNKFLDLYKKNLINEKQIFLLNQQNQSLLNDLNFYKKENELLKIKLQHYKNLILSSNDLNFIKSNIHYLD